MWPDSVLELYTMCGQSASVLINYKFQMHVSTTVFFYFNQMKCVCTKLTFVCACGKIEEKKIYIKLKLEISKRRR
jgi:hypothetical protein